MAGFYKRESLVLMLDLSPQGGLVHVSEIFGGAVDCFHCLSLSPTLLLSIREGGCIVLPFRFVRGAGSFALCSQGGGGFFDNRFVWGVALSKGVANEKDGERK